MAIFSHESSRAAKRADEIQPQTAKAADSKRKARSRLATVSWYGRLLIIGLLLAAAGWELFQWVLVIITQD